jgi:hypothetical protein
MIITCVICGHTFNARVSNAKYCSDDCRKKAKNLKSMERTKKRKPFQKTCAFCGESFETLFSTKKYCSIHCKRKAANVKKRKGPVKFRVEKKEVFDLCSICGTENIQVEECPVCGFLVCNNCRDSSGTCKICANN